ncbi:SIS domain-containing protein [Intrasporangium sp.]|uniref:SIS domain-containing protein n=1 Tax=Intrasporangium sp. TaxID=1925024 RepID=UPI0032219FDB
MSAESGILAVARQRMVAEADGIRAAAEAVDTTFVHAASLILTCEGKLFVGGSGTSGTVARRMAHILSVTGTPAVAFSPMDSLHGSSGAITATDLVLLISNGGASAEVIESARIVQRRGARVIALTRSHTTPLARLADLSVAVAVDARAELGGVVATGITLAQSAWGDALAEVLMRGRGYRWQQFMDTHPAGAVGQLEDLPPDPPPLPIPALASIEGARR